MFPRSHRRIRILAAAAAAALTLAGCGSSGSAPAGGSGPQQADTVTIGVRVDEGTLTPYTQQTGYPGNNLVALVYDSLLERDANNELKPLLAKGFKANPENTEFTVEVRTDVKWHDGKPFTAEDVAFSVDYYRQNPQGDSAPSIQGIEEVTPRGDSVVFTLSSPDPDFPNRLLSDMRILPKHIWQSIDKPETATVEQAVGTGPYKLTKYTKGQGYELTANPDYAMGEPKLQTIKISIIPDQQTALAALRAGEVSILTRTIPEEQAKGLAQQPAIKIKRGSSFTSTLLAFNNGRPPFDDPKVRSAISAAIDTQELVDTVLRGRGLPGSAGFWHPDAPGADTSLKHEYDPQRAKALLDEVGAKPGPGGTRVLNGKPMNYTVLVQSSSPSRIRSAELIRDMLKEVGIGIEIRSMDSDSVDAKVWPGLDVANGRNYDMTMWGWSAPVMLDRTSLANLLDADTSVGRLNITGTDDPEIDRLTDKMRTSATDEGRRQALAELQRAIAEKVPFVTLYYPENTYGYRQDVYDGWVYQDGQGLFNKQSFVDLKW